MASVVIIVIGWCVLGFLSVTQKKTFEAGYGDEFSDGYWESVGRIKSETRRSQGEDCSAETGTSYQGKKTDVVRARTAD